jgi:hypothetical protein
MSQALFHCRSRECHKIHPRVLPTLKLPGQMVRSKAAPSHERLWFKPFLERNRGKKEMWLVERRVLYDIDQSIYYSPVTSKPRHRTSYLKCRGCSEKNSFAQKDTAIDKESVSSDVAVLSKPISSNYLITN